MSIKSLINRFKPYLRWAILALTLAFLIHTLRQNWRQVLMLRLTPSGIAGLTAATGITLLAHIWSGWVWHWILECLQIPALSSQSVILYLKTNIAKYLPGNVWHFLGRIQALRAADVPTPKAVVSVVLEPLLMAAAALMVVVVSQPSAIFQGLILIGVLVGVHPRILNPIIKRLSTSKLKKSDLADGLNDIVGLNRYPLKPLLGEIGFVLARGAGFWLAFAVLMPTSLQDGWLIVGNFSLAWLLGLVIPGAPGGLGVFEATLLALLVPQFPAAVVLGAVALYRLLSTVAEALGAALALIDERCNSAPDRAWKSLGSAAVSNADEAIPNPSNVGD